MYNLVLLTVMAQVPIGDPPPSTLIVFGRDRWYQSVRGDEEVFVGVLERLPGERRNNRNAYQLVTIVGGRTNTREVYVGENHRGLASFANRQVRITGMAIDLKVGGQIRYEIWPATIEIEGGPGIGRGDVNIVAQAEWPAKVPPGPAARLGSGQQQLVLKTPEEFARAAGSRNEATAIFRALRIEELDWRRYMVIVVTGGIQPSTGFNVEITNLALQGKLLIVQWRVNPPGPRDLTVRQPFHPSQVVVVPRFDGLVRFDPPAKR